MGYCSVRKFLLTGFNILLVLTAVAGLISLYIVGPMFPGFCCHDSTIGYEQQPDRLSDTALLVVTILGPFIIMFAVELWIDAEHRFFPLCWLEKSFERSFRWFLFYFTAFIYQMLICYTVKCFSSQPRPYFLTTCKPEYAQGACTDNMLCVTEFNCTAPASSFQDKMAINDTMMSFYSAHSSSAFLAAVFLVAFVELRLRVNWVNYLRVWLQLVFITVASIFAFSRVSDRHHHVRDVVVGIIAGSLAALFSVVFQCNFFKVDDKEFNHGTDNECLETGVAMENATVVSDGEQLAMKNVTGNDLVVSSSF